MIGLQNIISNDALESQLYFNWIDDIKLRTQLTNNVKSSKIKRQESQLEVSKWVNISLTKIKEIEKGVCKDFNAINNYCNYFGEYLI